MPWYVFQCEECGEEFTTLRAWNRKSEVVCPKCGSSRLREQMNQYRTVSAGAGSTGSGGSCGSASFG
ncbi:MAG TPA: zinc ribbon domain-containing protein [Firmicutes bacterium]|nr:zinc ribbon domain-containing protein [Bacillota bacterium]